MRISDEALQAAAELSARYITDRKLPDKAIDLIDEAASKLRIDTLDLPPRPEALREQIAELTQRGQQAAAAGDYAEAERLKRQLDELTALLPEAEEAWAGVEAIDVTVDAEDVAEIVADWTDPGLAHVRGGGGEAPAYGGALHDASGPARGGGGGVGGVSRARTGLMDPRRPIGSFIFLGPRCGQHRVGGALAEFMFDDEDAMVRIDMSEYMERHAAPG